MNAGEGLRLRPARADDAPRLAEIAVAAYSRYVDAIGRRPRPMTEDYGEVVERAGVTVAERDGEVAGMIVLDTDGEGFVVDNVAVDPARQGAGIGRALLEHAEVAARRAGFDSIYLYTHEVATQNLALYGRVGYAEYDRRPFAGGGSLVYLRKRVA